MRPAVLLILIVISSGTALAEDPRVTFLNRQLSNAKDARVRTQTVLLMGQTGSVDAVKPLCTVLKDPDSLVRAAAASALGELKKAEAIDCLKAALGEQDPSVRTALTKALKASEASVSGPASGALYFNVEPIADKVGDLPASIVSLTDELLRKSLEGLGAVLAPEGQDKKAAAALVKAKKLRSYQLRVQLLPHPSGKGLKIELLVMTYPDQSLKGSWQVKAAGGKPEALIKAMVPRVVEDVAADLEWKTP